MTAADDALMNDLVVEAEEDWIEFSDAVSLTKIVEGGTAGPGDRLRRVAPLVVELVRQGRLIPGEHGGRTTPFTPWSLDGATAAERIEAELRPYLDAGRLPLPGDICWFTTPDDPDLIRPTEG